MSDLLTVSHEDSLVSRDHAGFDEDWTCDGCGNTPDTGGFYPCDNEGTPVQPTIESNWDGRHVCAGCGLFFDTKAKLPERPALGKIDPATADWDPR